MKLYKIEIVPADNGWIIKEMKKEKIEDVPIDSEYFQDYKYERNTKVFGSIKNALKFLERTMNEN